jgi:drug/metabolite transporter (DMT)-like permease
MKPVSQTAAAPKSSLALLALLTLVWGTNWPLFPLVMREMDVWTFRGLSLVGSGTLLLVAAKLMGMSLAVPRARWGMVAFAATAYLGVWNICSALATTLIPSGQAAVLGFTMPLWLALLSWVFFGQRLTSRLMVALVLGLAAIVLLLVHSRQAYAQAPLGTLLGLAAAIGWALGTMAQKRWPVAVPVTVLTGWQLLITGAVVLPLAWAFSTPTSRAVVAQVSPMTWLLVAYITVMPTTVGNLTWFKLVDQLPAQVAALSSVTVPIVAMIAGAVVHREPLGPWQWAAMACSAASLGLAMAPPSSTSTSKES